MKIEDILSKVEIEEYHQEWDNFSGKNKLNSSYNVHSGMPVISEIYQYKDKPIFRTRVFQDKLRKFNPYFISDKYHNPFWHAQHYLTVFEQIYHASSNLLRDNSKLVAKDPDIHLKIRKPIFWGVNRAGISAEMILEHLKNIPEGFIERGNFRIYDGREKREIAEVIALVFYQPRAYIKQLEKIKQNKDDKEAIERLIRQINWQDLQQKRLYKQRTNLPDKDYLIEQLRNRNIPEAELDNFFSLWNKPNPKI